MSEWNNGYSYNDQFPQQGTNSWNGDMNSGYGNQSYYPNRQYEPSNQYVSFDEFVSQIHPNNAPGGNLANFNTMQYQNFSSNQYNYENTPTTSQNSHMSDSNTFGRNTGALNNHENYNVVSQFNALEVNPNEYTNEMVLKSNLTPTATEFVPKYSTANMQTSSQNSSLPEPSTSAQNEVSNRKGAHSSSSDTNWRERPQTSQKENLRYFNQSNSKGSDSKTSSQENGRNEALNYRESRNRNESNRNDYNHKGPSKSNLKSTGKEGEAPRTFYNSQIAKNSNQDMKNGRGSGSNRQRGNWAGSQRLRAFRRDNVDDEHYANSYVPIKEEKSNKVEAVSSPHKSKPKYAGGDQTAHTEMTQRERLSEQLDSGTLECLVCCERVKQTDSVWSCGNCYHVLHLRCIRKWAMSSVVEGKWRCPACQNTSEEVPTEYRCMCGATRNPEHQRSGAHTCGRACRRARPVACPHPCTLLCHPGPCPPCQATIQKQCGCGVETRSVLCSSKLAQVCGRVCGRALHCGAHHCARDCHEGPCDPCDEIVTQVCYCPARTQRSVQCGAGEGSGWSCGAECARVLSCGAHVCRRACHAPPCAPCAAAPAALLTCPCGKMRLEEGLRKSCTDPIPLCGSICAKPLPCGPVGDKHFCKQDCHEGECPTCPDKTLMQCRCGHSSREVACADMPEMFNNVLCQKKCNKKMSCGRHRCRGTCCAATSHRCAVVCARALSCQLHRCEEFCHTGHCAPCPRVSFSEVRCACGLEVLLPPVRCGARAPACAAPCRTQRPCRHPPHHSCHEGECPPCVVLTTKRCHGDHEERKTIPCSQEEFSCGLPCGKPLPCGKHTCIKTCHKGSCDTAKCTQPCLEKRPSCGHECAAPCHSSASGGGAALCPSAAPCRRAVRATCACGRRSAERPCYENARDYAKIMSTLAAAKMQEGGTVDLSEVQRPGAMLKTLECDEVCRAETRSRQLALALQLRNPDVSAKLAPRYSDHLRAAAVKDPAFALHVHDKLTDLVQLAKKSKQKTRSHSFPSMNYQKRQFIHELCEHFGCESVAYDAEPNRNVVATADKEKSWLPAMSVLEMVSREAGRRRVPGPVLRAAPPAAAPAPSTPRSSGSWAKLTSSNTWAARSQPRAGPAAAAQAGPAIAPQASAGPAAPPVEKIDYFDNPPDN